MKSSVVSCQLSVNFPTDYCDCLMVEKGVWNSPASVFSMFSDASKVPHTFFKAAPDRESGTVEPLTTYHSY